MGRHRGARRTAIVLALVALFAFGASPLDVVSGGQEAGAAGRRAEREEAEARRRARREERRLARRAARAVDPAAAPQGTAPPAEVAGSPASGSPSGGSAAGSAPATGGPAAGPAPRPGAGTTPAPATDASPGATPLPASTPGGTETVFGPSAGRPFAVGTPFTTEIPAHPVLDPAGAAIVAALSSTGKGHANLWEYGVPVYDADASTPRVTVDCTKPWGPCLLEDRAVPVPHGAVPNTGDDGAMVVVDWSTRTEYDFWQARPGDPWRTSWGSATSIDGDGRTTSGGSGSGVSRLAGMVRVREIEAGVIDHPLALSSSLTCAGSYRYPARSTDGRSTAAACVPEGARLQLDPAVDVDAIPGITPGERVVARALQRYGAYVVDTGGANMAFLFERAADATGDQHTGSVYEAAGFDWDYFGMSRIPWSRLRLLRSWDGS